MAKPDAKSDDLLGVTISGRYRIISRLGAGGMGVAYRAWDEAESVPVVIKIPKQAFLEDPTFAERFAREIRLLQGLSHPHIVPIVDVGEHDGLPFVVMRFLPGGSLSDRRLRGDDRNTRPNPPGMLHLWLPAVADALDYVHHSGVVHRDVKPGNIFFDASWGAFLGDFGIAKIVAETDAFDREATLTATSMGIGTPDYMAPELFTSKPKLDGRTDQYALAIIAYEMLAGTRPFTGDAAQVLIAIATQLPPRLDQQVAGLPASAVEAVHRGLAKKPADRFPSCRQFAAALLRDIPRLEDETDTARFLCPNCSNLLKLPTAAAGRKGKCPKCKQEMKVADDLGALWLLDEVERQQATGTVVGIDTDWTAAQTGAGAADAVGEFTPLSTTQAGRPKARRRRGLLAWIDGHGLLVAAALGLLAVIPWLLPAPSPTTPDGQEVRSLKNQLQDFAKREDELRRQMAELQASRDATEREVAELETQLRKVRQQQTVAAADNSPPEGPGAMDPSDERPTAAAENPKAERRVWLNTQTDNVFVYDPKQNRWREGNLKEGLVFLFAEIASTPEYVELSDEQRVIRLRLHDDKVTAYRRSSNTWADFKPQGRWISYEDYVRRGYPAIDTDKQDDRPAKPAADAAEILARPPLENSIGMKLKLIPAGTFMMGSEDGEPDEKPAHEVTITKPFFLGVTEVTNAQWKRVMGGEPPSQWKDDDRPVEQVSWLDAVEFCRKLSALPEEQSARRSYRLPTEAEWEYACRAGTKSKWSMGDDEAGLGDVAWFTSNSGSQTHAVGQKRANPWGLHDMHGNVWEWCSDWYGPYAAGVATNPKGPDQGSFRVIRGGGWDRTAGICRSAIRRRGVPSYRDGYLGFRLALSPSDSMPLEAGDQGTMEREGKTTEPVIEGPSTPAIDRIPIGAKPAEILARPPLENSIGIKLKLIPAGTFMMGSEDGDADEKPVHEVTITKPFYVGVTEVTNAQWRRVMGGEPPSRWKEDDRPVERVSWDDAVKFCRKLSEMPDERSARRSYRLPTEAEWEYACRAGSKTPHSFGFGDDQTNLGDFAWFESNSGGHTHAVGQKKPNPWGLYDMHGNVWEWCADWYGPYPAHAVTDTLGPNEGPHRVFRGGRWSFAARDCRSANRNWYDPFARYGNPGLRLALSPSDSEQPEAGQ